MGWGRSFCTASHFLLSWFDGKKKHGCSAAGSAALGAPISEEAKEEARFDFSGAVAVLPQSVDAPLPRARR
jgi:hypothetical protein